MKFNNFFLLGLAGLLQMHVNANSQASKFTRSESDLAREINKDHLHRHISRRATDDQEAHLGFMIVFDEHEKLTAEEKEDYISVFGEFETKTWSGLPLSYLEIPESLAEDVIQEARLKTYVKVVEHELSYTSKAYYWNKGRIGGAENTGAYNGDVEFEGNGHGVHIYVLDSGIDDHPEFENRIDRDLSKHYSRPDSFDCLGHGTQVAGVAAGKKTGIASAATLVSYALLDCDNRKIGQSAIVTALNDIKGDIDNKPYVNKVVINISLGPTGKLTTEASTLLAESQVVAKGAVIVRAAGNTGDDACLYGQDGMVNSLSVGSSTPDDERAEHSNWGPCVDLFAPGINITFPMYEQHDDSSVSYGWGRGTSFAAPLVSGAAAIMMNNEDITGQDVMDKILSNAAVNKLTNLPGSPTITNNKLLQVKKVELYRSGNKKLYKYIRTHSQSYVIDCPVKATYTYSTIESCANRADTDSRNTFEYLLYKTSSNCIMKDCGLVFDLKLDTNAGPGGVLIYTDFRGMANVVSGFMLQPFSEVARNKVIGCDEGTMFSNRVLSLEDCVDMATFAAANVVNFEMENNTCSLMSCPSNNMVEIDTSSNTWVSYKHHLLDDAITVRTTPQGYRLIPAVRKRIIDDSCSYIGYSTQSSPSACSSNLPANTNAFQWDMNGKCEFYSCNSVAHSFNSAVKTYNDGARLDHADFYLTYMHSNVVPKEYLGYNLITNGITGSHKLSCSSFRTVKGLTLEDCAFYSISVDANAFNYRPQTQQCQPNYCISTTTVASSENYWYMYIDDARVTNYNVKYIAHFQKDTSSTNFNNFLSTYASEVFSSTSSYINGGWYRQAVLKLTTVAQLHAIGQNQYIETIERSALDQRMASEIIKFDATFDSPEEVVETVNKHGTTKFNAKADSAMKDSSKKKETPATSKTVTVGSTENFRSRRRSLVEADDVEHPKALSEKESEQRTRHRRSEAHSRPLQRNKRAFWGFSDEQYDTRSVDTYGTGYLEQYPASGTATVEQCKSYCQSLGNCYVIDYNRWGSYCHLSGSAAIAKGTSVTSSYSYYLRLDEEPAPVVYYYTGEHGQRRADGYGVGYVEKYVGSGTVTVEECKDYCNTKSNCQVFDYNLYGHYCHISTGLAIAEGTVANSDYVNFVRSEEAPVYYYTNGKYDERRVDNYGTGYLEKYVGSGTVTSDECKEYCNGLASCAVIDYNAENHYCHLSTSAAIAEGTTPTYGYINFVRSSEPIEEIVPPPPTEIPTSISEECIVDNIRYTSANPGSDVLNYYWPDDSPTLQSCIDYCDADPDCYFFNWRPNVGPACQLYGDITIMEEHNSDYISGSRSCGDSVFSTNACLADNLKYVGSSEIDYWVLSDVGTLERCIQKCEESVYCKLFSFTPMENIGCRIFRAGSYNIFEDHDYTSGFKTCAEISNSNVALGKPVTASSIYGSYPPSKLTDGSISTFAHTLKDHAPWFEIDLEREYNVQEIIIYNRQNCCQSRIRDFVLSVGNEYNQTVESFYYHDYSGDLMSYSKLFGAGIKARYVRLQIPTTEYLNIGEIMVMGNAVSQSTRTANAFTKFVSGSAKGQLECQSTESYGFASYTTHVGYYLGSWTSYGTGQFPSLEAAKEKCNAVADCGGVNFQHDQYTLRQSRIPTAYSTPGLVSYVKFPASYTETVERCKSKTLIARADGFNIDIDGNICTMQKCTGKLLYSSASTVRDVYVREGFESYVSFTFRGYLNCPVVQTYASGKTIESEVFESCKDRVRDIGASGFTHSSGSTSCSIRSCTGDEPDYAIQASEAYTVFIWWDQFINSYKFNGNPITLRLFDISSFDNAISKIGGKSNNLWGSVGTGTFDIQNGGYSFAKFQQHFGNAALEGKYGYQDKKGVWEFEGVTSDQGAFSKSKAVTAKPHFYTKNNYWAGFDVNGGYGTFDENAGWDGYSAKDEGFIKKTLTNCGTGSAYINNGLDYLVSSITECKYVCSLSSSCKGFDYCLPGMPYSGGRAGAPLTGACYFRSSVSTTGTANSERDCYIKSMTNNGKFDTNGGWGAFDQNGGWGTYDQNGGWGIFDQNGGWGTYDQNGGWGVFDQNGGFGQFDQNGGWGVFDQLGGFDANEGKQGLLAGMLPGTLNEFDPSTWTFDTSDTSYALDSFTIEEFSYENFVQVGSDKNPFKFVNVDGQNKVLSCPGDKNHTSIQSLEDCIAIIKNENAFSFSPALQMCTTMNCNKQQYETVDGAYGFLSYVALDSKPITHMGHKVSPFGEGITVSCKNGEVETNEFEGILSLESCLATASRIYDPIVYYRKENGVCTVVKCVDTQYSWTNAADPDVVVYVKEYVSTDEDVLGGWTPWGSSWGLCSTTCGGGQQYQYRSCASVTGTCSGSDTKFQACNTHSCATCDSHQEAPCSSQGFKYNIPCTPGSSGDGGCAKMDHCCDVDNCINCYIKDQKDGLACTLSSSYAFAECARWSGSCGGQPKCGASGQRCGC